MTETIEQNRLDIVKEIFIAAGAEDVFEAVLEQTGPYFDKPDGEKMPMKIEPWPGGRWFRDTGNNTGHFWGHIQVIKPPTILEIVGPMFMSFPVMSHLSYRIKPEGDGCRLTIAHKAFGDIPAEFLTGVNGGWSHIIARIAERAVARR